MKNLLTLLLLAGMASAQLLPKDLYISSAYGDMWEEVRDFRDNKEVEDWRYYSRKAREYTKGIYMLQVEYFSAKNGIEKQQGLTIYCFDTTGEQIITYSKDNYAQAYAEVETDSLHSMNVSYNKKDGIELEQSIRNKKDSTYETFIYRDFKLVARRFYDMRKNHQVYRYYSYADGKMRLSRFDTTYSSVDTVIHVAHSWNKKAKTYQVLLSTKEWKSDNKRHEYAYHNWTFDPKSRRTVYKVINDSNDVVLVEYKQYKYNRTTRTTYDYAANKAVDSTFNEKGELLYSSTRLISTACSPQKQNQSLEYANAKGGAGKSTLRYDEGQDCRTRIVEQEDRKGRTYRIVTTLDHRDQPVLTLRYDHKNQVVQKTIYTYTYY